MDKPVFSSPTIAEASFYAAFADCSVKNMDNVWGLDKVICIHPGAPALVGREAVMNSWARILVNAAMPEMDVELVSSVVSDTLAVHVVREIITPADGQASVTVQATNVYQRDEQGWHIIEHHGSPAVLQQRQPKVMPRRQHTLQ